VPNHPPGRPHTIQYEQQVRNARLHQPEGAEAQSSERKQGRRRREMEGVEAEG